MSRTRNKNNLSAEKKKNLLGALGRCWVNGVKESKELKWDQK